MVGYTAFLAPTHGRVHRFFSSHLWQGTPLFEYLNSSPLYTVLSFMSMETPYFLLVNHTHTILNNNKPQRTAYPPPLQGRGLFCAFPALKQGSVALFWKRKDAGWYPISPEIDTPQNRDRYPIRRSCLRKAVTEVPRFQINT